jgi:hypothetical protein
MIKTSSRVCVQSACGRPAREVLTSPVLILSEEEKRREEKEKRKRKRLLSGVDSPSLKEIVSTRFAAATTTR